MRNRIVKIWVQIAAIGFSGLLLASSGLAAQQQKDKVEAEDVKQEITKTYELLKDYTLAQRDEALAKADAQIEKLDRQIDHLRSRLDQGWDKMNHTARIQARDALKALRKQREVLAEWYGGMRHSSTAAWEEVKKGFSGSYERLEKALMKAEDSFIEDEKDKSQ